MTYEIIDARLASKGNTISTKSSLTKQIRKISTRKAAKPAKYNLLITVLGSAPCRYSFPWLLYIFFRDSTLTFLDLRQSQLIVKVCQICSLWMTCKLN